MDALEDNTLLKAIAQRRDRAAANTLFDRYEKRVYGLALNLTQIPALAEEAVQEAFMEVWRTADQFRFENAQAWILRIVAHVAIRLARKERSRRVGGERMADQEPPRSIPTPVESVLADEMRTAIRGFMEELPDREREALALRYGAGLTQQEIGRLLSLSQGVISRLLNQGLDRLRARLAQAGYAGLAIPLLAAGIGDAVCLESAAPAGLHAGIMARLHDVDFGSGADRAVRAASRPRTARTLLLAVPGACLLAAGLAATLYWGGGGRPIDSTPTAPRAGGLVLHLPLDEGIGEQTRDVSGRGHDGELMNGPEWVDGRSGKALAFGGDVKGRDRPFVRVKNIGYGRHRSFTVAFWFQCLDNRGGSYQYLFSHGIPEKPHNLNVYIGRQEHVIPQDRGVLRTFLMDEDDESKWHPELDLKADATGLNVLDGAWHHYGVVVDRAGSRVYIDGVARASSRAGGGAFDPKGDIVLGGRSDLDRGRFFRGALDDLRIYDRALAPEEMRGLAAPAFPSGR
jgi:RNA polymerase sigma-70 factor (ECF subfamily)